MCKCGNEKCKGFYLLHPKEMIAVQKLKETELIADPDCTFDLRDSPSSGEVFTKFRELHVLGSKVQEISI